MGGALKQVFGGVILLLLAEIEFFVRNQWCVESLLTNLLEFWGGAWEPKVFGEEVHFFCTFTTPRVNF